MLNELYQVSQELGARRHRFPIARFAHQPMGKNRELLIVRLNAAAEPSDVEFVSGAVAAHLFRVEHGSAGSSFPGFNLPTPLLDLTQAYIDLKPILQRLCELQKKKDSSTQQIYGAFTELAKFIPAAPVHPQPMQAVQALGRRVGSGAASQVLQGRARTGQF